MKQKIAVVGYGNLGKSVCKLLEKSTTQELVAIYSRRDIKHPLYVPFSDITCTQEENATVSKQCDCRCDYDDETNSEQQNAARCKVGCSCHVATKQGAQGANGCKQGQCQQKKCQFCKISTSNVQKRFAVDFDVALLCLGSYDDVEHYVHLFDNVHTVDSYDNVHNFENYKKAINTNKQCGKISIVGAGWDPGILTIARAMCLGYYNSTVWGEGISQGHTNAIKSIEGVIDAVQITVPKTYSRHLAEAQCPQNRLHNRMCYVACEEKDRQRIEEKIKSLPHYFDNQDVTVVFCTVQQIEQLKRDKSHQGNVLCFGDCFTLQTTLKIVDNTLFTAKVMLKYAWAIQNLEKDGYSGALDVLDVPLKYIT